MTITFAGMPDEGLAFLEDLEDRNTKEFFDANKAVFRERVQAPFAALVEAAAARLRRTVPDLGQPKVFRIYRDLRFSRDKTPYKTSMSASVPSRPAGEGGGPGVDTGFYVNVGPAGLYVASGLYHPARPELERVRAAIADPGTGPELEALLAKAAGKGLEPYLDPLQRMPKPFPADHPRAGLLKARSLVLNRQHERAPWLRTAELLDHLVADWKAMIPFNRWLEAVP
ncbi:MAG TPA: DUF2461 domain-containing protein [Actinomycetota bacterium]|nr:DUF2461 domain-containing protein [Actinomycetota bacterium]